MNILDLRNAIETKLNTLKGTGKPIVEVLNYHTIDQTGFPYITFEPSSLQSDILDSCNNIRSFTFDIFIYEDITTPGREERVSILSNCFQEVIDLFDSDYTLGGLCEAGVIPMAGEFGQFLNGNGDILFANLKIVCKIINNIYPN